MKSLAETRGRGYPASGLSPFSRHAERIEIAIALGGALAAVALGYAMVHFGAKMTAAGVVGALIVAAALVRIEVGFGLLFFVALVGPSFVGYGAWTPVTVLVIGLVLLRELLQGRGIPLWGPLVVYAIAYLLIAAHGGANPAMPQALSKYLLPPALALATAAAARDARLRTRIVVLLGGAVAVQVVIAGSQALQGIGTYGRSNFQQFGDFVTGTLGSSASGLLTLISVAMATVVFALAIERVWKPKLLMLASFALAGVGIISVARAVFFFVPAAFGAVLLAAGVFARRSIGLRRVVAVATVLIALTPGLVIGMSALYPGVTEDINSVAKLRDYLFLNTANSGPTPERGAQIELAVSEFKRFTVDEALLGRGVGYTWLESDPHFASSQDFPVILKPQEFANSVWIPRALLEGGLLGMAAFVGLLVAMANVTRRARGKMRTGTVDSALMLALPGLAALTFVAALYLPVLASPPYATIFWTLLGVCLAIARSVRETPA
jgi:hypothetical protein